ncbi:MAG: 4Fe-4S binding protein, partial [Candidatus Brocadiales bacterium]
MSQGKKSPFRAYKLRKWSQALSLAAFIILLIYLDPLTTAGFSARNFFLRLSPLSGLGVSIAAHDFLTQYWPALVLVAMTLFMGRFFCGWICPFGTTIDLTDKVFKGSRAGESHAGWRLYDGKRLKYYLLAFLLLSLFLSRQMVGWFDPLSLVTNVYSILIHPYIVALLSVTFDFLHGMPVVGALAASGHEFTDKVLFVEREPFFHNHSTFLIIFLAIVSFGFFFRRYWSRNLCPLGALLALVSVGAYLQRSVREDCEVCDLCQKGCRMGCITEEGRATQAGECILCMDCQEVCPSDAIRFRGDVVPQLREVDLSKRGLVTACLTGIAAVPMLRFNFPWRSGKGHGVIRPPGSVDEQEFLARCVCCGECMKVCKTNGLHPTLMEAGLEAAWTPRLIPRIGHCDYSCTLCTEVCPSG